MTRGKGGGGLGGRVGFGILEELAEWRKHEQRGTRYRSEGRWDQRRTQEHTAKLRRTKHRQQMAKLKARPKKRAEREPRDPFGLSIAKRVVLHMLPGEWLGTPDIARRAGIAHSRPVTIKLIQALAPRGIVAKAENPDARSPIERCYGGAAGTERTLYALTSFGCAMRAALVEEAEIAGAPFTEAPSDWKIPGKFLESFGIDFSPFFDPHAKGSPSHLAAHQAHARALHADAAALRAPHGHPWEWCGHGTLQDGAETGQGREIDAPPVR